jgi:hypothetical protein
MNQRPSLLLGSMPFENEAACMQQALEYLSDSLVSLPDGELSDKPHSSPKSKWHNWSQTAIEKLSGDPSYWDMGAPTTLQKNSFLNGPKSRRASCTNQQMIAQSSFGYEAYFQASFPIFLKLRQHYQRPDLTFQVGVSTGFATGLSLASKHDWSRYTSMFNRSIAKEINTIYRQAGQDVLFQIEVPTELYAAYLLPTWLISQPLRPIIDLLEQIEPGARIGIHLCIGSFQSKALASSNSIQKMVDFSNWLVASWPVKHQLEYIHFPLAEGESTAQIERSYYKPLAEVYLPSHTQFFAGIIHEKQSVDQLKRITYEIEKLRKSRIGIASSCGLGCRSPEIATQLLKHTAQVASA